MFENFEPTTFPDNRHHFLPVEECDEIIIGATCTHIFNLPFNYNTFTGENKDKLEIFYKQGLFVLVEKHYCDVDILVHDNNTTTITVKLCECETQSFRLCPLNTFVQMKIVDANDNILYNEPSKLIVKRPLDK